MLAEVHGGDFLVPSGNPLPAIIVVIVVLGLLTFASIAAVRMSRRGGTPASGESPSRQPSDQVDPALAELKEQFVRGEVGEDEYLRKVSLLGYPTPGATTEPSTTPPA